MNGIREPKRNGGPMSQSVQPSGNGMRPGYKGKSSVLNYIPGFNYVAGQTKGLIPRIINKIKPSFLTGMQVQYGGDRFTAYEQTDSRFGTGSPPQKSQLTLNFSELETLSQESVGEGY